MTTNKQIVTALKAAKKYLATNSEQVHSYRKTKYICFALGNAEYHRKCGSSSMLAAQEIIMFRLGRRKNGIAYDVEFYLKNKVKVPKKLLTVDNIQAFRHRWLDSLIVEFSTN